MVEINISSFFGRLHPALVHLPIGILLLAFIFQLLSYSKRYKKLKAAVRPALFYGMLSAALSAFSGYILSQEGGYDVQLLNQHKWMGIATVCLSFLVYLFRRKTFALLKSDQRKAVLVLFFPLSVLVVLTGHWGGSLTRGEGYLFEIPADAQASSISAKIASTKTPITNVAEAKLYEDIIQPLLEAKCYACHSSKKQKGQLRLDEVNFILKGGKNGEILAAGNPLESELFKRVTLPIEEKEHMPPRRESQLTSSEVELLRWWITEGASFKKEVGELTQSEAVTDYLKSISSAPGPENWVPEKKVAAADSKVINELRSGGVSIAQIESASNYLSVSFAGRKKIEPGDVELLKVLSNQIIELNLARTSVTDDQLLQISELKELRRLHLEHTQITDLGIAHLKACENLSYLNLIETKVSDVGLKLVGEIKSLKELYLFNTNITKEGLRNLNPQIKADTGKYQLPFLASDTVVFRKK